MAIKLPSREELMGKSLRQLRTVYTDYVRTPEDEELLNEVINIKASQILPEGAQIYRMDVPDIKTREEEEKWQKIIDERNAKLKPKIQVKSDEAGIEIKIDQQIEKKQEELQKVQEEIKSAFKCKHCEFTGKNANGLRLHAKKHANKS